MSEFGGEVTNPKIFIRNKTITRDGLLSEQIFGPIRSYTCACGKFNESLRTIYEGQTCDKCGVKCISNEARLTTFGKITLAFPVIKPTKRKKFKSIVGKDEKHLLDPEKAEISASLTRYLAITPDGQRLFITDNFSDENNYIVPLRITGLYSFILSLKYVANYLGLEVAKSLFTNNYIMGVIKVLPPDIRPIVKDPKKPDALRVTEVNKPYVQLLQLNKANEVVKQILPDKEADWLSQIHYNFKNQLDEEIVDQLIIEYDFERVKKFIKPCDIESSEEQSDDCIKQPLNNLMPDLDKFMNSFDHSQKNVPNIDQLMESFKELQQLSLEAQNLQNNMPPLNRAQRKAMKRHHKKHSKKV